MSYEPTFILGGLLPEDDPFVTGFLRMSVQREYPAGHVLVRQGEPFQNLLLILSGAVETSFFSETGRKKILTINQGICFFGASAIDGSLHTMNYACLTPTTVAVMDPERLRDWDGQMLLALAKLQKKKERILNRQLQMRAFCSAEDRILCVLKDLAYGDREPGAGHITHQTIAEIVGATRVQVCKTLKKFEEQGIIRTDEAAGIILTGNVLEAGS